MEHLEAALFGILQGLTEFLPVSSSGHLAVFNRLFSYAHEEFLFQVIAVHVGTLLAVVLVFWRDILSLFGSNRKVVFLLAIGTVPAGIFGFLSRSLVEGASGNMVLVGVGFLTTALFLMLGHAGRNEEKPLGGIKFFDSIIIGFAQALAVLPGVSRSGSTISFARYRGIDGDAAARFSFLLMLPAVGGAALLDFKELLSGGIQCNLLSVGIAFAAAFVVGVVALKLLLALLSRGKFSYFAYYLFPLGLFTILLGFFS